MKQLPYLRLQTYHFVALGAHTDFVWHLTSSRNFFCSMMRCSFLDSCVSSSATLCCAASSFCSWMSRFCRSAPTSFAKDALSIWASYKVRSTPWQWQQHKWPRIFTTSPRSRALGSCPGGDKPRKAFWEQVEGARTPSEYCRGPHEQGNEYPNCLYR